MGLGWFCWSFLTYLCTLSKLPFLLQRKLLQSVFPSLLFQGKQVPTENQCHTSTHGRDLGELPAPPPWANQIVLFLPTEEVCMNNFTCFLLNYWSISWVI